MGLIGYFLIWTTLLIFVFLISSCSGNKGDLSRQECLNENLHPDAKVSLSEEAGEIEITLGYINQSDEYIPEIDDFEGNWTLQNSEGKTRARGSILAAGPFEAGESKYPLTWRAKLDPDNYTLMWAEPSMGTVVVEFQVDGEGSGVGIGVIKKETFESTLIEDVKMRTE